MIKAEMDFGLWMNCFKRFYTATALSHYHDFILRKQTRVAGESNIKKSLFSLTHLCLI